ncbi:hypothetical protein DFR58_10187 [Anaerobacterium chartisolvens]|uniref:Uncharacterized protein n=1 Tax=Anaerobacterium chartisolvens TaxID=1297424 RepID=A0A369BHZ3_9FIRM|nr:hypothetical protein [Anaerobacterium chartisolvens]RCX20885.1 hypothetical protein DFR58_10187 [Anaerobacterium chartisolvens]
MIKVKNFKVRHDGKTYTKGETIPGLSQKEEARLVSEDFAEYILHNCEEEDNSQAGDDDPSEQGAEEARQANVAENSQAKEEKEEEDGVEYAREQEAVDIQFNPDEYIQMGNEASKDRPKPAGSNTRNAAARSAAPKPSKPAKKPVGGSGSKPTKKTGKVIEC